MKHYYQDERLTLLHGDAIEQVATLDAGSVQTVVTSPPYFGLRDYGAAGQVGHEETPAEFIAALVAVFDALAPALREDGTLWLNMGDTYVSRQFGWGMNNGGNWAAIHREAGDTRPDAERTLSVKARSNSLSRATGLPNKSLIGVPWRLAIAMQEAGWLLRQDIIWNKPNGAPARLNDRFQSRHEHVFLFSRGPRYKFYPTAVEDDTDVWRITPQPFREAHFAVMPQELAKRCIVAATQEGDTVLDPFSGSGTTGQVALRHGRKYIGIDLNADYLDLSLRERFQQQPLDIFGGAR